MLVLSRRHEETIVLPQLGVTVEVLSIRGNLVKIGIDAPREIQVLRGELCSESQRDGSDRRLQTITREEFHDLKNRLNTVSLSLELMQKQRDAGLTEEAERTFQRLRKALQPGVVATSGDNQPADNPDGCQALLVEDDANERALLAGLLRMRGHSVATAADGLEALEYLKTHAAPDIVLLDMRMPRFDGRETIEMIRSQPSLAGLLVYAVSATDPETYGVPVGSQGVAGWFAKPLNPELVAKEISRTMSTTASA